jgi:hypothetical protein
MFLVRGRSELPLLALLRALLPGFAQLLDDDPGAEAENANSSGTAMPSLANSHWKLASDMQASHSVPTSGHSNGSSSGGDGGSDAPGPGGGGAPGQFFCPPIIDCSALLQRGPPAWPADASVRGPAAGGLKKAPTAPAFDAEPGALAGGASCRSTPQLGRTLPLGWCACSSARAASSPWPRWT